MPFYREINPVEGVRVGIWQITETADELLARIQLSSTENLQYNAFRNDMRKRHWLAYRVLIKHLLAPLATGLSYDLNGKPHLDSGSHHISVSHAGDFAAAVICTHAAVGIDIEKIRDRVVRVKDRFLCQDELESLDPDSNLEQLHIYWGGKEALYKLSGQPGVDFRNDIHIHPFDYLCHTKQNCTATITIGENRKEYTLFHMKIEEYMLVVAF